MFGRERKHVRRLEGAREDIKCDIRSGIENQFSSMNKLQTLKNAAEREAMGWDGRQADWKP